MAGAEARALWQRTANRCFVQEDAKRAPKLACCQSSSSIKQADGGPTGGEEASDHHPSAAGSMPLNRNPSHSNLPPDNRWWFQLQPRYEISSDCTKKDGEVERLFCDENAIDFGSFKDSEKNSKQIDFDPLGCLPLEKGPEHSLDVESSPWMGLGAEKNVPWWRLTDKDDLASLVSQKSLDLIDNCDLPPPQKIQLRRLPRSSDREDTRPSLDWKAQTEQLATGQCHSQGCRSFESTDVADSYTKTSKDTEEGGRLFEDDPCKAQLLEALRHSQTRAREAENMAKQASAEKDDIVKLFLRQASQLFAYKQWFKLLQLEALYYQLKNSDQPISTLFPVALPWVPQHSRKFRKSWQKSNNRGKRGKRGRPSHGIGRYAVAFAVGLSLVGAGLLLGWTVGWMLPF